MATPEPDLDDDPFNDYNSNTSFDQQDQYVDADVSSESEKDSTEQAGHKEYASYSHMVDVAVKSNGQMLSLHHNIVEGQPVFAFSEGQVWIGDTKHGVQVRDVKNFELLRKLGGAIAMRCMTIVDNEVWVGYCNGDIHVYDKNNLDKPPKEITSSSSKTSIDCIAYSDGIIWTGSADWELRARRQSSGATIRALPDGHRDWIRSILIVGSNLWSSGDDSFIYIWNAETGEKVRTIETKTKQNIKVKCAVLCVVGATVWGGCADGYIRIWDHSGEYRRRFRAHKGAVTALVSCGAHVWSGGLDKNVKIWERESVHIVETMPVTFSVLTMGMHGTHVYLGGRGVVQVRMTSGLLEWLRDAYGRLDADYSKVLQVYESLLVKYETAEPEKMRGIIDQLQNEREVNEIELDDLRNQVAQMKTEVETLVQDRNELSTKLEAMEGSNQAIVKEMEAEKEMLRSYVAEHKATIETKAAEYKSKAVEYETRATENNEKMLEYQTSIDGYRTKEDKYELQLRQHESDKQNLVQEVTELQTKIENLQSKLDDVHAKLDLTQHQLDQATEHGINSKDLHSKQDALNAQLNQQVTILENQKQTLMEEGTMLKEVIALKESKTKADHENQMALEEQILRLESEVRSRDDNLRVMRAKHDKEVLDAKNAVSRSIARQDKPAPVVEMCAISVIFVLCACLVLAMFLFLFTQGSASTYSVLQPH